MPPVVAGKGDKGVGWGGLSPVGVPADEQLLVGAVVAVARAPPGAIVMHLRLWPVRRSPDTAMRSSFMTATAWFEGCTPPGDGSQPRVLSTGVRTPDAIRSYNEGGRGRAARDGGDRVRARNKGELRPRPSRSLRGRDRGRPAAVVSYAPSRAGCVASMPGWCCTASVASGIHPRRPARRRARRQAGLAVSMIGPVTVDQILASLAGRLASWCLAHNIDDTEGAVVSSTCCAPGRLAATRADPACRASPAGAAGWVARRCTAARGDQRGWSCGQPPSVPGRSSLSLG
jgi:hypothetical protein